MAISIKILTALSSVILIFAPVSKASESIVESPKVQQRERPDPLEKIWRASGDTVVGTVNQVNVTKNELLRHLWFQSAPAALDDLMKKRAIKFAADAAGIKIGPDKLESKIRQDIKQTKSESFDALLRKEQMTQERYKGILLVNMLLEEYVRKQVTIVAGDYDKWVKVRYIFIADPRYESDMGKREIFAQESKKKADEILTQIKAGKDFAEVADQYSDSPENVIAGKKQGGSLGWITGDQTHFTRRFEEACFSLETGNVSNPVRADFGWYLIKSEAVGKDTNGKDTELNQLIVERKVRPAIDSALDGILAGAKLDNRLVLP